MPAPPGPVRELAQGDHADEDQSDDQHAGDDVLALGGGVGEEMDGEHAATLSHAQEVGRKGPLDRFVADGRPSQEVERLGVAFRSQRISRSA